MFLEQISIYCKLHSHLVGWNRRPFAAPSFRAGEEIGRPPKMARKNRGRVRLISTPPKWQLCVEKGHESVESQISPCPKGTFRNHRILGFSSQAETSATLQWKLHICSAKSRSLRRRFWERCYKTPQRIIAKMGAGSNRSLQPTRSRIST